MVFSSLTFICIFLPAVLALHQILPSIRLKNAALLIASIVFYAYGEPVYVILLLLSALVNWALALWIDRSLICSGQKDKAKGAKKLWIVICVIFNAGLLGIFKYSGFLVLSLNKIPGVSLPVPKIALPIGISFYTFQAMSYVIDVYRRQCNVQKNYFRLLLYISLFPQLIAGPIVKYRDIEEELTNRRSDAAGIAEGIERFLFGLAKKVLIANNCAVIVDTVWAAPENEILGPAAWLAAFAYLLQIYFDFSGYSDMAIGLGKMFGFHFRENFNAPYTASSIQDFWRRWHISLSTWLREYLYIPLGGNRKGKRRTVLNKLTVFLVCGIWHGANVTFLVWGLFHGLLLLMEEACGFFHSKDHSPAGRIVLHVYTLLAVLIGFVIFRADDMGAAIHMLTVMFTGFQAPDPAAVSLLWSVLTPVSIGALVLGTAACCPVAVRARRPLYYHAAARVLSLAAAAVCILNLAGGTYNPFIYFRF